MVEKIFEASINVAIRSDSSPDDNALFNLIEKKKKQEQDSESSLLVAIFPPNSLVRLTTTLAQGGHLQRTEKQTVKEGRTAFVSLATDIQEMKKGDGLRRQVALAVAKQMYTLNTYKKSESGNKENASNALGSKMAVDVPKAEKQTIPPVNVVLATLVDATTKYQQSVMAEQSQAVALANPIIVHQSTRETDAVRQKNQLWLKEDDISEAKSLWHVTMLTESTVPKQDKTTVQSKNSSASLQQLKTQATSAKGVSESKMLEVKYQFQRWTGDHSVKISVPTETRREGKVSLLPSDMHAADALLRNMSHLKGLTPDLLQPQHQQERDEQQREDRQQQQGEDQE